MGKTIPLRYLALLTFAMLTAVAGIWYDVAKLPNLLELEKAAAIALFPAVFVAWLISVPLNDVSIVDILWSLGFLIQAVTTAALQPMLCARQWILLASVVFWAFRLAGYLTVRKIAEGGREDPRYNDYVLVFKRDQHPRWLVVLGSLGNPFIFQGCMMLVIGAPLILTLGIPCQSSLGTLDGVAALLWLIGFAFEAGGDWQLARFKADPTNRGRVLDTGFFRNTRHPNYFGDATIWFSFWLVALAHAPGLALPLAGCPFCMYVLLRYVSGAEMLDAELRVRRPAYRHYIDNTSAFFPCPLRCSSTGREASSAEFHDALRVGAQG